MDLLRQVVEGLGTILLDLTFAYPERFALATVAAHAESEQGLARLGSLELHNGVHRVIFSAHLDTQGVFLESTHRNFQA